MRYLKNISARQARLILLQKGLLDEVEAMVAADRALSIWWEYSVEIERNSPLLLQVCDALNISEEQLDEMFIEASKL